MGNLTATSTGESFTPTERPTEPFEPSRSIAPASGVVTTRGTEYEEAAILLTLSIDDCTVLGLYKQTGIPARVIQRVLDRLLEAGTVEYEKQLYKLAV